MDDKLLLTVVSHDGWNRVSLALREPVAGLGGAIFAELHIEGDFWDRAEAEAGEIQSDARLDHAAKLPQVRIALSALNELEERLEEARGKFDFQVALSEQDPKLTLTVAPREDFISSAERPVFSLRYETHRMKAEWAFVVEPNALDNLRRSLQRALTPIEACD